MCPTFAPSFTTLFTVLTSWAKRSGSDGCDSFIEEARLSHVFNSFEGKVSKTIVPVKEKLFRCRGCAIGLRMNLFIEFERDGFILWFSACVKLEHRIG